jgi:hypothetical protein
MQVHVPAEEPVLDGEKDRQRRVVRRGQVLAVVVGDRAEPAVMRAIAIDREIGPVVRDEPAVAQVPRVPGDAEQEQPREECDEL